MAKIYTKTGDRGDTGLFDGTRVRKHHERVDAYGEVDELNSILGAVVAHTTDAELRQFFEDIQRDLFTLGANLANPKQPEKKGGDRSRIERNRIEVLERRIDSFETELPPLRQFILPGGGPLGAWLHVARSVCRRAERRVVALSEHVPVDAEIIEYLNRLSDLLFVAARLVNQRQGHKETVW